MPNNAEYIKILKDYQHFIVNPVDRAAFDSAILALREQGKSPWRKVTKRHPGKKWVGQQVLYESHLGRRDTSKLPNEHSPVWVWWLKCVTRWQPWPEHPEKGKVK